MTCGETKGGIEVEKNKNGQRAPYHVRKFTLTYQLPLPLDNLHYNVTVSNIYSNSNCG
jgi:hypothetical protein